MKQELRCKATIADFDHLHYAIDKLRANSKTVKVDRDVLERVLRDHSVFHDMMRPYFDIIEPEEEENDGKRTY